MTLIDELRSRISGPINSDEDFLLVAESAGLLCGITGEPLAVHLVDYLRSHEDLDGLMIRGLREVEHVFYEAVGEDLSLAVTLTQEWVLLAEEMSKALRPYDIRLSARFWVYLGDLEELTQDLDLTEYACEALEQWRSHTNLPEDKQIAALSIIMSGAERILAEVLYEQRMEARKSRMAAMKAQMTSKKPPIH